MILVILNENCRLCMFHRIIFPLLIVSTLSCNFNRCTDCFQSFSEGGVRVCGIAVLGCFWCGFAVIFISKHSIAVFKVQAVCGNFKFYVAVIGEKIAVSR